MPLPAALAVARETRRRILAAARKLPPGRRRELLTLARAELRKASPLLARTVRDGQLLAWLEGGKDTVTPLDLPPRPPDRPPDEPVFPDLPGEPEPPARFPAIEAAARYLEDRLDTPPAVFARLDDDARRVGFAVAEAAAIDAETHIRKALARDVTEGGTLRQFRAEVADALAGSGLADYQVEGLYRTQVGRAYSAGQIAVLNDPVVGDEFPYLLYNATHDARVRPEHLALESMGLDGTAVYRRDDPFWHTFYPPWAFNCRCVVVPLSIEDAAARGVMEAVRWRDTGEPPAVPQWVAMPTFRPPKGWVPVGPRLQPVV